MSDPGIELGDGVYDFEKVPPHQLCPSAKVVGSAAVMAGLSEHYIW